MRVAAMAGAALVVMILAVVLLAPQRSLPSSPRAFAPPVPKVAGAGLPAALSQGKVLFERSCMKCHGPGA